MGAYNLHTGVHRSVPNMTRKSKNNTLFQELICVFAGYGVSTYRRNQIEKYISRNSELERQELHLRRRNAMLMDAYGEKSSLADIERAMALYETQQGNE